MKGWRPRMKNVPVSAAMNIRSAVSLSRDPNKTKQTYNILIINNNNNKA